MSQENVELVRSVFDAWNRGELGDVLPFVAEDIEWLEIEGLPDAMAGEEIRGSESVRSMLESLFDVWESYRLEPEVVRAVGDNRVFAVLREVARGRVSGAEVAGRWGYVIEIRDGKVARVEAYRNAERALEAAGLSE
jgi:ketosteroid isomerase-like protein